MGRPSQGSSFLDDPSAKFFCTERGPRQKPPEDPPLGRKLGEVFCFCFSSLAEPFAAARSGQGGAAFRARRERTLDGEDRCERIAEGGKELILNGARCSLTAEGNHDK